MTPAARAREKRRSRARDRRRTDPGLWRRSEELRFRILELRGLGVQEALYTVLVNIYGEICVRHPFEETAKDSIMLILQGK